MSAKRWRPKHHKSIDNRLGRCEVDGLECRKRAENCRAKARGCDDEGSRIFWLDLADRWDQAAEEADRAALSDPLST
jgi:hypothetical protein